MDQSMKAPEARKSDPETKLAQQHLSVLELPKRLGNLAEACRQRGFDRTSFCEWKRRFQTYGLEGLKALPPIHKSNPQTTPPETVERIPALALAHPACGCQPDEFFLVAMRDTFYDSAEALQADLDARLVHYNTERPHLGCRNMGGRPAETVMPFVSLWSGLSGG